MNKRTSTMVWLFLGLTLGSPHAISAATPADFQMLRRNIADFKVMAQAQAPNRDILWSVVQCLGGQSPALQAGPTSPINICGATVFDASAGQDAVVVEDRQMSGCKENAQARADDPRSFAYVHALTIPLAKVTGVEQRENRPQDIWALAWQEALFYIPAAGEIALVVESKQYRSQDQLHVHIVRLKPGAMAEILQPAAAVKVVDDGATVDLVPHKSPDVQNKSGLPLARIRVAQLGDVWKAAEDDVAALGSNLGTGSFGVAVVRDEITNQYAVVAVDDSPNWDFAAQCGVWKP